MSGIADYASYQDFVDLYRKDEGDTLGPMIAALETALPANKKTKLRERAEKLVVGVRNAKRKWGELEVFLQEYGLTTPEGVSLMCLAEALLRVPDPDTANELIRDKISGREWDSHLTGSDLFVNASGWGLMLTGKVLGRKDLKYIDDKSPGELMNAMTSRLGEPVIRNAMRQAMRIMGRQFVMGRTIDEALERAADNEKNGYRHSYDMLGEGARTMKDARRYFEAYKSAVDAIGKQAQKHSAETAPSISVKLSALHPRYHYAHREECIPALAKDVLELAQMAKGYDIGLTVDAEETERLSISLDIIDQVAGDPSLAGWNGFGLAVQAYQKRAAAVIDLLAEMAQRHQRKLCVRLVKGAYWDTEIKNAQVMGHDDYPVFTRKANTDVSYLACAKKMLDRRDVFYPQLASHNAQTVAAIMELAGANLDGFEFQRLHGMGQTLYDQIIGDVPCRIYAPVGSHEDLLPYLVRRLLENGANSSFVNRIQNPDVPVSDIVIDPLDMVKGFTQKHHPEIPKPRDIYKGDRLNSIGLDLDAPDVVEPLIAAMKKAVDGKALTVKPMIDGKAIATKNRHSIRNPANHDQILGEVHYADAALVDKAFEAAKKGFHNWSMTPADARAKALENLADLMEEHMVELMALCTREAGKTLHDGIAEIREAVDFCRYYAARGREYFGRVTELPGPTGELNTIGLYGRGVFVCISPWNFPLAICCGQIVAALMAGNAVISKPAEQTSLVGQRLIELAHEAGVPKDALAFLPGDGETVGSKLVNHRDVAGVAFTGSTEVARLINQSLAQKDGPIVPLIAETGGQNAMIVDSSALPEQVVDDVLISAFGSAGQRCSAMRILYLQDDIADKVIEMLKGAMQEMVVGDPMDLKTDVGPVIDKDALDILQNHKKKMHNQADEIFEIPLDETVTGKGTFCAPCAYEISDLKQLEREVFGPVLHVIRYKADALPDVINDINSTGYGLTFGIHTRIEHRMQYITQRMAVGNAYVNRTMIGAVVGVQPFGGQGLSGTGPKAGGPHYLYRFATERVTSIDTTASGGNTTLVCLGD